ncbi:MAG: hypothetical protein Q7S81_03060 [bacterium]|nr:hypothetical protein [bacterium]
MKNLLDLFNELVRGRKDKSENPVVLPPLIKRLNLPEFPRFSGERLRNAVVTIIRTRYGGKRISARVVGKIASHYGVKLYGTGIFRRCRENRSMLVVTPA